MLRRLGAAFIVLLLVAASADLVQRYIPLAWGQSFVQVDITATATGTTGAVAATLASLSNKTTYLCGFVISSGGVSVTAVGDVTITGVVTATTHFTYVDPSSGQGLLGVAFPRCVPAIALGTNIVVTAPASGGSGTTKSVTAWGYQI